MINTDNISGQLESGFHSILRTAAKQAFLAISPDDVSETVTDTADKFADTIDELTAKPLADLFASVIEYAIKSVDIYGTVITVGNRVTQTAKITGTGVPLTNGVVPNSLGIK